MNVTIFSHAIANYSFFPVVIKSVLEINNQPEVTLKVILMSIQTARRNIVFEAAKVDKEDFVEEVDGRADRSSQCDIDTRMDQLLSAIANFRIAK